MIVASLRVGQLILIEATLSFLGAGLPKSVPAWGVMVASGQNFLQTAWWGRGCPRNDDFSGGNGIQLPWRLVTRLAIPETTTTDSIDNGNNGLRYKESGVLSVSYE